MRKALDVVKKFEMAWPDVQGNLEQVKNPFQDNSVKELKPLTAGDRLGLYKMPQPAADQQIPSRSQSLGRMNTGLNEQDRIEYSQNAAKQDYLYGEMTQDPSYSRKGNFLRRGQGKTASSVGAYQASIEKQKEKQTRQPN